MAIPAVYLIIPISYNIHTITPTTSLNIAPSTQLNHSPPKMPRRGFKTRVFIATSLDGYIARENNDVTWLTSPPKNTHHLPPTSSRRVDTVEQHISRVDCMIMGRRTYDFCISLPEWPYAKKRTFVLSRSMAPGVYVAKDIEVEVVRSLDEAKDVFERERLGCVYVDGGEVVTEFLRRGWVDEMIVTTAPVLLGNGIRLFGGLEGDVRFTLVGLDAIEEGMVSVHYTAVNAKDG
ncbi:dihydrofolate reductase-like domain-containing protein [Aspergillus tamarii]|uniref:2,5-diamino-6-ribosylamino-4(3H)-pyrimidinone 5'-phosphate reductase n=1 Tax=Aspergillus tamarii TaxID=41984 RepID=A0A5N6UA96_ASPTM|nr:dihydrofolate reductase-like domain-containing protein [Aspergillus tamarii]